MRSNGSESCSLQMAFPLFPFLKKEIAEKWDYKRDRSYFCTLSRDRSIGCMFRLGLKDLYVLSFNFSRRVNCSAFSPFKYLLNISISKKVKSSRGILLTVVLIGVDRRQSRFRSPGRGYEVVSPAGSYHDVIPYMALPWK